MSRCKTRIVKYLEEKKATELYTFLKENIQWTDGIKTKHGGFTRKACMISVDDKYFKILIPHVLNALEKLNVTREYGILGLYLNYQENGEMYTPMHAHKTDQVVISLGETRDFKIGKKMYKLSNGDAVIFGKSSHGVPKQPEIKNGRISIATFMFPV